MKLWVTGQGLLRRLLNACCAIFAPGSAEPAPAAGPRIAWSPDCPAVGSKLSSEAREAEIKCSYGCYHRYPLACGEGRGLASVGERGDKTLEVAAFRESSEQELAWPEHGQEHAGPEACVKPGLL